MRRMTLTLLAVAQVAIHASACNEPENKTMFGWIFQGGGSGAAVQNVGPADVSARLNDFTIVDVRQPDEFTGELGHIKGAKLIPLGSLAGAASSIPKDKPVLVVCRSGGRSARGASQLAGAGFAQVYNLSGGMLGWNDARLPVTRSAN